MGKVFIGEEAEVMMNLSYNIRYTILDKNTSVGKVADQVGISRNTLRNYIRCETLPDMDVVKKIAEVLECDVSDLTKPYDHRMPGQREE